MSLNKQAREDHSNDFIIFSNNVGKVTLSRFRSNKSFFDVTNNLDCAVNLDIKDCFTLHCSMNNTVRYYGANVYFWRDIQNIDEIRRKELNNEKFRRIIACSFQIYIGVRQRNNPIVQPINNIVKSSNMYAIHHSQRNDAMYHRLLQNSENHWMRHVQTLCTNSNEPLYWEARLAIISHSCYIFPLVQATRTFIKYLITGIKSLYTLIVSIKATSQHFCISFEKDNNRVVSS